MRPRLVIQGVVVSVVFGMLSACTPGKVETEEKPAPDTEVPAGGEVLQGVVLDPATGLTVFRGIPFAAPPTGDRRWKPPAPHTPREGVQSAETFGPACPQLQGNHDWYRNVATLFGNPPETIGPLDNISEDCLHLNVWTNNLGGEDKLPVMVWIYGGANKNGYSHEPNYRGQGLAERGVVYVSLNYRVGIMGFLAHAGLAAESDKGITGNYGILDQVAALKWVRENIGAFGGDPHNVTILGESAGAANSGTLAASPLGDGLFHRIISQSGGYQMNSLLTQEEAEVTGAKIATHLRFESPLSDVEIIEGMRELGWEQLMQDSADAKAGWYTAAIVDGYVLKDYAANVFSSGENNDIDILIGSNANENYMYMPADISREQVNKQIEAIGEPYASELMALLSDDLENDYRLAADRLSGATTFLCTSKFMATQITAHGGDVYFYHFSRVRPNGDKILAYHGAEIPYALDTADSWLPADDIDAQLTNAMAQYWVNFAATGTPNGDGLVEWPAYSAERGEYIELGDKIVSGDDLETEICAVLDRQRQERLSARIQAD